MSVPVYQGLASFYRPAADRLGHSPEAARLARSHIDATSIDNLLGQASEAARRGRHAVAAAMVDAVRDDVASLEVACHAARDAMRSVLDALAPEADATPADPGPGPAGATEGDESESESESESDPGPESADPQAPPKRRPGRPRKNPAPE